MRAPVRVAQRDLAHLLRESSERDQLVDRCSAARLAERALYVRVAEQGRETRSGRSSPVALARRRRQRERDADLFGREHEAIAECFALDAHHAVAECFDRGPGVSVAPESEREDDPVRAMLSRVRSRQHADEGSPHAWIRCCRRALRSAGF